MAAIKKLKNKKLFFAARLCRSFHEIPFRRALKLPIINFSYTYVTIARGNLQRTKLHVVYVLFFVALFNNLWPHALNVPRKYTRVCTR